jgi:YesN/AraC family two-component response regulator
MTAQPWVVLIVEDESLIRMGIAGELEDEGFTVFEAADADAAIVLLNAEPSINLLLTDVDMPGTMNGLRLAAAVSRRWPPIKIIVASGQYQISVADLPKGGRFFAKPYRGSALADAFREMAA